LDAPAGGRQHARRKEVEQEAGRRREGAVEERWPLGTGKPPQALEHLSPSPHVFPSSWLLRGSRICAMIMVKLPRHLLGQSLLCVPWYRTIDAQVIVPG